MRVLGLLNYTLADFFEVPKDFAKRVNGGSGTARKIGQVTVASLHGSTTEIDLRNRDRPNSFLDFIFFLSGHYKYAVESEWFSVDAQLVISPSGISRMIRFEGPWEILVIRLPREAAESMTPNPAHTVAAYQRVSLLERAMFTFANTLICEEGDTSAVELYAFEQLLLEMGGASMLDRIGGGWAQGAPHAVILDRAKAIIAQQCADPMLSPTIVAFEVQSSLRQLQAIFNEAGTSIAAEIRSRRAHGAYMLLRDARYDVLTTDQIAERSGFGTTTSMRRALQEIYGLNPSQARRQRD